MAEEPGKMAEEPGKRAVSGQCCEANDLVGQKLGILLWWLPTLAIFLGLTWNAARPWLWIPAFLVMGVSCLVNAARCDRVHCYVTGPIFLIAAVYVALAAISLVPLRPGIFLFVVFGVGMLACLAEIPLGRYKKSA